MIDYYEMLLGVLAGAAAGTALLYAINGIHSRSNRRVREKLEEASDNTPPLPTTRIPFDQKLVAQAEHIFDDLEVIAGKPRIFFDLENLVYTKNGKPIHIEIVDKVLHYVPYAAMQNPAGHLEVVIDDLSNRIHTLNAAAFSVSPPLLREEDCCYYLALHRFR